MPGLQYGGGIPTLALFLYRVLQDSGRYQPGLVSLAVARSDPNSVRLLAPRSWWGGVRTRAAEWGGLSLVQVGAFLTEFETQRYHPRKALRHILEHYDLVQVVAGTPSMALSVADVDKPACLYVATTVRRERASLLAESTGLRRAWASLMTMLNARSESRALAGVQHVFALSEYTRTQLGKFVPEPRLSLGLPGIDTAFFRPAGSKASSAPILSVGRFSDPRKNVSMLFAAYRYLRERWSVAPRLLLAGDPPRSEDWALAVRWGIANWIEVRPNVSMSELAGLYREAGLFVLTSNEEGLGIVLLEAMASGLPTVSTRCGGPETCIIEGQTGYLTPVGDAEALADRMQAILEDPSLALRMGSAARRIAEERFSLPVAGKHFLQVYDKLLG